MNKSFRRILNLIRRTGDRMVVTDPEGEDAFVVMDLDQYEALLDLDSGLMDEFLGDDDGEDWGGPPPDDVDPTPPKSPDGSGTGAPPADIWQAMAPAGADGNTWNYEKMDAGERTEFERAFQEAATARPKVEKAAVPVEDVSVVEEPVAEAKTEETSKKDDDFGEEQFYLEPIE